MCTPDYTANNIFATNQIHNQYFCGFPTLAFEFQFPNEAFSEESFVYRVIKTKHLMTMPLNW